MVASAIYDVIMSTLRPTLSSFDPASQALPAIGRLWSTYDDDNNVGDDVDNADWIGRFVMWMRNRERWLDLINAMNSITLKH